MQNTAILDLNMISRMPATLYLLDKFGTLCKARSLAENMLLHKYIIETLKSNKMSTKQTAISSRIYLSHWENARDVIENHNHTKQRQSMR